MGIKELPFECYKFIGADLLSFDSIINNDGTIIEMNSFIVKIVDCSTDGKHRWLLIDSEASGWLYHSHQVSKLDVNLDGQWVSFCDGTLVSFGDHSTVSYRISPDSCVTLLSVSDLKIPTVTNLLSSGDNLYLLSKAEHSSIQYMVSNYTLSGLSEEKADINVTKMFKLANDHVLLSNEFSSKIVKLVKEEKKIKIIESNQAISLTTLDAAVLDDF